MKQNKKGQVLEAIGGTFVGVLVLIVIIFAALYGISALNPTSFFPTGSFNANQTSYLQNNLSYGAGTFAQYIPTVFIVFGVVLILSVISLLILYVRRMQGTSGGGMGSL